MRAGRADQPRAGLSATLVGRESELAAVVSAVSTPPSLVTIEGEAGIGKTRLVRELREHPSMAGRCFVVGACRAIQEPFPLGPVLEAVHTLRDRLQPEAFSPVVGVLRPLLPELADVLPPPPEPLRSVDAGHHRVFRALREVLQALSPLTLVLEDLHWADELTVDLLRYLFAELPDGLSLVLTMRAEDADLSVRALASRLTPPARRAHVSLAPLDRAQTGELAARLLATDRVTAEFAAYLRERTGGLPFAIEELTALLRDRGVVASHGSPGSGQALEQLADVPVAVRDHVLERASLLPVEARALVDILAVLQSPAPEALLAQVADQPPEAVAAGLGHGIRSGLLVDDSGRVGFRHVLAAQAVYDGLPGPRRRELHNRVASALHRTGTEANGQLAFQLRQAGRLAEWAAVSEQAAERAAALHHFDEAVRLLEDVLRHGSIDQATRVRLSVQLGWAARATLRGAHVTDLLAAALNEELPRTTRAELQLLLGAALDDRNLDWREARALFAGAVENSTGRPDLQAWAMIALEIRNTPQVGYAERHRWLSQVLELISRIDDVDFQVHLLGKVGLVQAALGDPRWREVVARVDEQCGGAPTLRGQIAAYESISQAACFAGHHREAQRMVELLRSADYLSRDERLEAFTHAAAVLLDYCCGRWDGLAERAATLLERLPYHQRAAYKLHLVAGALAGARGDLAVADERLAKVLEDTEDGDLADVVPMITAVQIRLALGSGDHDSALATAERYLARQQDQALWPAVYRCLPALVEALTLAGQTERARTLAAGYAEQLHGRDAPLAPAASGVAEGLLLAATGDRPGAAALFLAAAERYDRQLAPVEAAQARAYAARSLAEAGSVTAAEQPLRAAMTTYERLGATWDLAQAVRLAHRYGVPVPTRHRGGRTRHLGELTPRERQVAELAATGRTNKQIAAQLYLSTETVKKHLQAVMRKLAVPSRAALARHLPPSGQPRSGAATPSGV